jgi:hypothetical protein
MPARDGTGPVGQGSRTGRGLGNCESGEQPVRPAEAKLWWNPLRWIGGISQPDKGLGRGNRRGWGRGRGRPGGR